MTMFLRLNIDSILAIHEFFLWSFAFQTSKVHTKFPSAISVVASHSPIKGEVILPSYLSHIIVHLLTHRTFLLRRNFLKYSMKLQGVTSLFKHFSQSFNRQRMRLQKKTQP